MVEFIKHVIAYLSDLYMITELVDALYPICFSILKNNCFRKTSLFGKKKENKFFQIKEKEKPFYYYFFLSFKKVIPRNKGSVLFSPYPLSRKREQTNHLCLSPNFVPTQKLNSYLYNGSIFLSVSFSN